MMHEMSWSSLLPLANGPLFQEMKSTTARLLAWAHKYLVSQPCLSGCWVLFPGLLHSPCGGALPVSSAVSALLAGTWVKPGGDMLVILNGMELEK